MDEFDHKTLRDYLKRLEENIKLVERRLQRFEEEFGMDSELFYSKLQNAALDERIEYAEWAGEHEMLKRLKKQRDKLKKRLQGSSLRPGAGSRGATNSL